ncbi:hypothetical protein DOTSEDRAFT_22473 [Dothistroma septosporum NZE10]|uniref:Uncharacterized protein n=1 Tax=Dothistroma septosporum (strain NZE10 / CBS 128990) TaxID=675120 RepID=N1PVF4_DOTSN|nr:hypothetical protein DOTSEDRAFT_22473 [Dothistroma septosporum NZE10]
MSAEHNAYSNDREQPFDANWDDEPDCDDGNDEQELTDAECLNTSPQTNRENGMGSVLDEVFEAMPMDLESDLIDLLVGDAIEIFRRAMEGNNRPKYEGVGAYMLAISATSAGARTTIQ